MTISTDTAVSGPYTASGSAESYPFSFQGASSTEVQLTVDGFVVPATIVLNADGTGSATPVTVATVGAEVYVESNPDFTQGADFTRFGPYFPDAINPHLDRAAIRDIALRDRINRAPVLPRDGSAEGLFPVALPGGGFGWSSGTGADSGLRGDLAASSGGGIVGLIRAASGAVVRSLADWFDDQPSVMDFIPLVERVKIRLRTSTADCSSYFQAAANAANVRGGGVVRVPYGLYRMGAPLVCPNAVIGNGWVGYLSHTDPSYGSSLKYAVEMKSGVHFVGENATIKAADNISTDASPQNFALFFSLNALTDIRFEGIEFDLNGVNNKMSPNRANTGMSKENRYGRKWHAAIMFEGRYGKADDMVIRFCDFRNTAGISCVIAGRVAPVSGMGKRWLIEHCGFYDNGIDSYDHSSIFLWCDQATVRRIRAENTSVYAPSLADLSGMNALVETHGSDTLIEDIEITNANYNIFVSYNLNYQNWGGAWGYPVSNVAVRNVRIKGAKFYGIDIGFAPVINYDTATPAGVAGPRNIVIEDMSIDFSLDDTNIDPSSIPTAVAVLGSSGGYSPIDRLRVRNVHADFPTTAGVRARSAQFFVMSFQASGFTDIVVEDCSSTGFTRGEYLISDANTLVGTYTSRRNSWKNPAGGTTPALNRDGARFLAQGGVIGRMFFDNEITDTRNAIACTFTDAGDLVTAVAHGMANNETIVLDEVVTTTGITVGRTYFVINRTNDTLQFSLTAGGAAVALTGNGTGVLKPNRWAFGIVAEIGSATKVREFSVARDAIFDRAMPVVNNISLSTLTVGRLLGVAVTGTYPDTSYVTLTGGSVPVTLPGVRSTDELAFSLTDAANSEISVTHLVDGFTIFPMRTATNQVAMVLRNVTASTQFTSPGFNFRITAYPGR